MYSIILKSTFAIISILIILTILNHSEIIQDKYGVLSREKTNILDQILLILFCIFFIIIYLLGKHYKI